ncbi:hypothetical protein FAES_4659 [Fibrella aestuarina BUZ 2]|uniref:Uncharacterized protein n=1 Tax=Fibrella aestuarina BUZ 2 TaxID=1166018 RepID=I0KEV5_9BACT|nr:hypothetical protein FAES_4659 [Fibrella aestuarina BUZ 2]
MAMRVAPLAAQGLRCQWGLWRILGTFLLYSLRLG